MYLRDFFGLCCQGLYLHNLRILGFIKHGSIGEVKDDGSHGEEGGETGYMRYISHYGRGWSSRPSLRIVLDSTLLLECMRIESKGKSNR